MEPMALGSAPASPTSSGVNSIFLPNFLTGETNQPTAQTLGTPSPSRNINNSLYRQPSGTFSRNVNQPFALDNTQSAQQFTPHKNGPPNQGLFDTLDQSRRNVNQTANSSLSRSDIPLSPTYGRTTSRLNETSLNSFTEINKLPYNNGIDTLWVTVFGFSSNALSMVLAQLHNCGTITETKIPSQGNWVHVKFSNVVEVSRAVALNGTCLNNCIMIGVSLYYNKENKENETGFHNTPSRARPLRQSFITPSSPNSVLGTPTAPQKSTGLVSKAMEYVFGW